MAQQRSLLYFLLTNQTTATGINKTLLRLPLVIIPSLLYLFDNFYYDKKVSQRSRYFAKLGEYGGDIIPRNIPEGY